MQELGLIPLRNFALVDKERGWYRSSQPLYKKEFKWLHKVVGIKTIINLRSEAKIDHKYAKHFGINVIDINVPDGHPPRLPQAKRFIDLMNSLEGPVLIHCKHGHGRTSTFCVLARIATGWTVERAIAEEKKKFHYGFKHAHQEEFLIKHFKK